MKEKREGQQQAKEWAWDDNVVEYAKGKSCRREVLDREMDGNIDRFGCIEGEEMCDICRKQQDMWMGAAGQDNIAAAEEDDIAAEIEAAEIEAAEIEAAEKAAADADYKRSQRLIRQIEAERRQQDMEETAEIGIFKDILAD